MLYFSGSLPKSVLTAQKKTAVIFSKWLFFQNSLVMSWAPLLGKMQVKKLNIFLNFSLIKFFNLLESYFLCTGLYEKFYGQDSLEKGRSKPVLNLLSEFWWSRFQLVFPIFLDFCGMRNRYLVYTIKVATWPALLNFY